MKTYLQDIRAKFFSWVQKKHDEQSGEDRRRKLDEMELIAFAISLLGNKLLNDLDQVMNWANKGVNVLPRLAFGMAIITAVLFVLIQVATRLIPGIHIP